MTTISEDSKAIARTTLQVLQAARLPAEQWQEIEAQLHALERALNAGDADAFHQTRRKLEQLSHPRIGQIGKTPPSTPQPPTSHLRDFINRMVDALQTQPPAPTPIPKQSAGQSDAGR